MIIIYSNHQILSYMNQCPIHQLNHSSDDDYDSSNRDLSDTTIEVE